jgi:cystathionine beta-lyase/cystathionine gamma-synthase
MKPATELIHVADGIRDDAAPLTTPIYETTTFVFESAQQVRDYNEGRSTKFLYSRYANPTVLAVEAKIAGLEPDRVDTSPVDEHCTRHNAENGESRSLANHSVVWPDAPPECT